VSLEPADPLRNPSPAASADTGLPLPFRLRRKRLAGAARQMSRPPGCGSEIVIDSIGVVAASWDGKEQDQTLDPRTVGNLWRAADQRTVPVAQMMRMPNPSHAAIRAIGCASSSPCRGPPYSSPRQDVTSCEW
jgi:hypothetical protein